MGPIRIPALGLNTILCVLTPFSSCTDVLARSLKISGGSGHLHKGGDLIPPAFKWAGPFRQDLIAICACDA
jgi:hypothetical protein